MGIKTKRSVGLKIKPKFGISNKKSFNSAEFPSLENSPCRLQNVSLFTCQQPANLFEFGTTQKLLEGHSQPYIPLIIFVGQTSSVHISGDGSILAKPIIDNNVERRPCSCTNAVKTDIPGNRSLNRNSDININVISSKGGCCCESFKDISLEERGNRQDIQTETSQSTHDGTFKLAGGTDIFKYSPVTQFDTILKDDRAACIEVKYHCITAMEKYENNSLEELRLEDYLAQNKFKSLDTLQETDGRIHSFGPQSNITSSVFNTYTSAGGINACRIPSTCFDKTVSNFSFDPPSTFNNTSSLASTASSAFGQQPIATFGKPVSNFTFGASSTSEKFDNVLNTKTATIETTATSLPSTTTSRTETSIFGKPNFTLLDNLESNSPFIQPLLSNNANNIYSTTTSTTGTSIFGKPNFTSLDNPESNSPFRQPLISNTANNIPSATTSTTATSIFGKPILTPVGKPVSNFSFGQPLTSSTTNNIPSATTSTTGTSIFGKPILTPVGKPVSNFSFGQPLSSSTTNNIPSTTTSTTGTSFFGKPIVIPVDKPVSNFSFGQPLTSSTTSNIPSTTTSTTGTSLFGKPIVTPVDKPVSNFSFGQPLTSSTTSNIPSTTTSTTGTSFFGKPIVTPVDKPVSNFSFGQPLTSSTTSNIPSTTTSTTGTSLFGKPIVTPVGKPVSNFSFGQPLSSSTTNNIPSTTTSTTGSSLFGKPIVTPVDKPVSNSSFGQPLTSSTKNNRPITTSIPQINTRTEQNNNSVNKSVSDIGFKQSENYNSIGSLSSTTSWASLIRKPNNSPLSKCTSDVTFGRQFTADVVKKPSTSSASTSSTNASSTTDSTQKITGIFGQQIEDKCVPPPTSSSSATRSLFSSKPTSGLSFSQLAVDKPFKFTNKQHAGEFFKQQTGKGSFPPTNLSFFAPKPKNIFDKRNANFKNRNHGIGWNSSKSWSPLTTQVFPGVTPNPFSTSPVSNNTFKWSNNNPFNVKITEKTGSTDLFNRTVFSPTRSGFASTTSTMKEASHFCSCNKPPFVLKQSSNCWFKNNASKSEGFAFEHDNNVPSNTAVVCPFCQTCFDRTQPNHFRKSPFKQQNWPQFSHNRSVCLFCSKIVRELQPFQGHLQQQNTSSPFSTPTQSTSQSSFFSQSNTPDINLDEVPSIAVICATPGNVLGCIGPATDNVFGNPEQNTSCDRLGTTLCPYFPRFENDLQTNANIKVNCITGMKEYENKSLEELRFEDYLINYKNRQAAAMKLIIGQVQSTLAQFSTGINDKSTTNTFGHETEHSFRKSSHFGPPQFNDNVVWH